MTNTQFAINGTVLDYDDDIGAEAMRMWADDPEYTDGDGPDDVGIYFPGGQTMAVSRFIGRSAGEDAEVEEPEYGALPINFATLGCLNTESF
jgi:hypothetical protein